MQTLQGRVDMLFMGPQSVGPVAGMPDMRHRDDVRQSPDGLSGMPGYTHTPGMIIPAGEMGEERRLCLCRTCAENKNRRVQNLDGHYPLGNASRTAGPVRCQKLESAPSPSKRRPRGFIRSRSGKVTEVAELDGIQVSSKEGTRESSPATIDTVNAGGNEAHADGNEDKKDDEGDKDDKESENGNEHEHDGISLFSLSLLFDILFLSAAHLYEFLRRNGLFDHSFVVAKKIFEMAGYCFQVPKRVTDACLVYQRTGSWPKASTGELALLMRDPGQAGAYSILLGFVVVILGRVAGNTVLIGSWVVRFAKPFGWVFGWIGKALLGWIEGVHGNREVR